MTEPRDREQALADSSPTASDGALSATAEGTGTVSCQLLSQSDGSNVIPLHITDAAMPVVETTLTAIGTEQGLPSIMPETVRIVLETRFLFDHDQAAEIYAAIRDAVIASAGDGVPKG